MSTEEIRMWAFGSVKDGMTGSLAQMIYCADALAAWVIQGVKPEEENWAEKVDAQ